MIRIDTYELKRGIKTGSLGLYREGRYKELVIVRDMLDAFRKDVDEQLAALERKSRWN